MIETLLCEKHGPGSRGRSEGIEAGIELLDYLAGAMAVPGR
jgi:hypothetical protein